MTREGVFFGSDKTVLHTIDVSSDTAHTVVWKRIDGPDRR